MEKPWSKVDLHGAGAIQRICSVYEIFDRRVPGTRFKVKVSERDADYIAVPNVFVVVDGSPDWISGLGQTELDALQDLIARLVPMLEGLSADDESRFEWADPRDF